jgi:hypothetical protein
MQSLLANDRPQWCSHQALGNTPTANLNRDRCPIRHQPEVVANSHRKAPPFGNISPPQD